ncbi:hypothetical protein CFS9_27380 [Flavobacterium sp. CFS9]|uniref:Uncharacterized protein n=1 Tax=Flavobacterium sp. CFS9 TaxID=3143118 RepID=A0AAT9H3J2_9FLAO
MIEDKQLKEIAKYINGKSFKYWILISYRRSVQGTQTFKEAVLINIEKLNYLKDNIFRKDNPRIILEIEEIRTVNFPLGSIFDCSGNLLMVPIESSIKNYVYKNSILIDPYNDFVQPFDKDEIFDTEFIHGVPCYYKKREEKNTIFIIPVHVILDFFFYTDTYTTNILVNNFSAVEKLEKIIPNILLYPSTLINQDSAKKIGKYFFTKYNDGYRALKRIHAHEKEWLNQAKNNLDRKAYITTNLPFGIKTYLSVIGIYLTDKDSKDKFFLVFAIEEAKPVDERKPFFEQDEIFYLDLNDKRSTGLRDEKEVVQRDRSVNRIIKENYEENEELSNDSVNNSLPLVTNETIKNNKFSIAPEFKKLDRIDQLKKYITNKTVLKENNKVGFNYTEESSLSDTARYQAIESKTESLFFRVFFKAIEFLKNEGYTASYLLLDNKGLNPRLTIVPSGVKVRKNLMSLVASICQIEIGGYNYTVIEAGENHYIGMFACTNNYKFNSICEIRIKDFLEKVINKHNYNWSKVNEKENSNFQKESNIKILRPIEHERKKCELLRKGEEKKTENEIIDFLAARLAGKIKKRILNDIK